MYLPLKPVKAGMLADGQWLCTGHPYDCFTNFLLN